MNQIKKPPIKHEESKLQQACVQWFRYQYPNEIIFAIPNARKVPIHIGKILKREGILSGVPDLQIPTSTSEYNGLFIEMKYGNNSTSPDQKKVIAKLRKNGYKVEVCYTLEDFINAVESYFGIISEKTTFNEIEKDILNNSPDSLIGLL